MSDAPMSGHHSGMKLAIAVFAPLLAVGLIAFGFIWWERGAPPGMRPTLVEVTPEDITKNHRGVQLTGTAHYLGLRQKTGDAVQHLFPVLKKGDTIGRFVTVVVRASRDPEDLVSFEDVIVEGIARPPGNQVPYGAREAIQQRGYTLAEDFVLVVAFDD